MLCRGIFYSGATQTTSCYRHDSSRVVFTGSLIGLRDVFRCCRRYGLWRHEWRPGLGSCGEPPRGSLRHRRDSLASGLRLFPTGRVRLEGGRVLFLVSGPVGVRVPTGSSSESIARVHRRNPCEASMAAPAWPLQPWFNRLLELCVDLPHELPFFGYS